VAGATIRIAILAQAAAARAELESLGDSASGVGDRITAGLSGIGEKVKASLAGVGVAAGATLVAGITGAIEQMDMKAKLGVQMGLTGADAARYGKIAGDLYGQNFGTDLGQVSQAVKKVYQDIGEGNDQWTKEITSQVLTVSNAMEQDLGGTTAAVGQMLRTGLAKDATEALDLITAGLAGPADKSGDLLETINEYSTQFRRVGLDGKTSLGLLSQALQGGARDADQVADALGQFGERALAGGKPVENAYKSIGLNAADMAKKIGAGGESAKQALGQTLDALRGTKDEQVKLNAAAALFGDPANVMGDALYAMDTTTAAQALGDVAGAAKRAVDTMGATPAAKIEAFKRAITQGATGAVGGFAGFATANSSWLLPLVGTLTAIGAAIWVVNAATRAWAAAQAAITVVTEAWKAAQLALNASFLANPIFLAIAAIVALVAAIVIAYKNSETFRNIVQAVWAAIQAAVSAVIDWFAANLPKLWVAAQAVWEAIKTAASAVWGAIVAVVSAVIGAIGAVVGGLVSVVSAVWSAISSAASAVWNAIKAVVNLVILGITIYINTFRTVATAVWNAIQTAAFTVWNAIKTVISAVILVITTVINTYKAAALAVWTAISSAASTAWNGIKTVVSTAMNGVKTAVSTVMTTVKGLFSVTTLRDAGIQMIQGLINGIKAMASQAVNAAKGVVNDAVSGAKKLLGIASPSKVFTEIGRQTGRGFVIGLEGQAGAAQAAAQSLVDIPAAVAMDTAATIDVTRPLAATTPAGQQEPTVLELRSSGSRMDDFLLEMLRGAVRARGGNVQVVLGR
jgi:phage-related minor tail protein